MQFHVRWPDGAEEVCYSPSLVVHDHLTTATYPVDDFVERCTLALTEADRRVREKYGFGCTRSMAQLEAIRVAAARHPADGPVEVLGLTGQP